MRFEKVTAQAFGPFTDRSLELTPGLNVIWGPNEAGKSTWHAALYAGLCGMRRVRGKATTEDQRFSDRHRPWDGGPWEVGATVRLEDGRRMELRHDLAGRVNSRASDAELGRDCSAEIIADGTPDGARWLGLDRRSFAATACIRQADLLGLLSDPSVLQEQLQRAADTGGTDATAAAALERIERFRAERVGTDRASSSRPLRQALLRLETARARLAEARTAHADYLHLIEEIDRHQRTMAEPSRTPQEFESQIGGLTAEELRARLGVLANQVAHRPSPPSSWAPIAGLSVVVIGIGLILSQLALPGVGLVCIGALALGWAAAQTWRHHGTVLQLKSLESERSELETQLQARLRDDAARADAQAQRSNMALELAELRGRRQQLQAIIPSVADAEERYAEAEAELNRIRSLEHVLRLTHQFLTSAQDQVHRSIAPILAESVRARLTRISAGRYTDVRVDPATLEVRVQAQGGPWREAALLSHGTAEQIYLLLRVALAVHLTRSGESCPLILDDVTAHCDDERTLAVVETLHEISRGRQVILFSQEAQVCRWAETALDLGQDQVVRLSAPSQDLVKIPPL
ncbi:MAG: ATP-binding protein [Chloroflexota bacterium]